MLATREVLANTLDHDGHLKDLIGVRSLCCLHLQKRLDQHPHVHRVVAGNRWELTLEHALKQTVHIVSSERWH